MKFFNKDFSSKYDQIHSFLRIWSNLTKKPLTQVDDIWSKDAGDLHLYFKCHSSTGVFQTFC